MGLLVGIISYLPDNEKIREARWKVTSKCIKNTYSLLKDVGCEFHIATTNWRDEEFNTLSDIPIVWHTIDMNNRGPAVSRNTLLEFFYSSDNDYILMLDDDIYIYDYYNIRSLFLDLHINSKKYIDKKLYYFGGISANRSPFKDHNISDVDFCDNWVFTHSSNMLPGFLPQIYANFKKLFNKTIYQDSELMTDLHIGGEDIVFGMDIVSTIGAVPYKLFSLVSAHLSSMSSFWSELEETRCYDTNKYLISLYPKAKRITDFAFDYTTYYPYHLKKICVERIEPYIYTDWDYPKKWNKNKSCSKGLLSKNNHLLENI